ncbi:hypothetical protein PHYPO_G00149280 [Pangasianodon hypophthalmus]|uniref:Uncharacterized protein n=1 Tax=Pangasianodon hypophthalmus TaxID=310915 RepID=A0A5N5K423_PANHP|nr:hypothetical protein PHYPO_G00149280 [Pangasianodon hypophthalmus]
MFFKAPARALFSVTSSLSAFFLTCTPLCVPLKECEFKKQDDRRTFSGDIARAQRIVGKFQAPPPSSAVTYRTLEEREGEMNTGPHVFDMLYPASQDCSDTSPQHTLLHLHTSEDMWLEHRERERQ